MEQGKVSLIDCYGNQLNLVQWSYSFHGNPGFTPRFPWQPL